ncbi:MAG TPA: hypothetical protein VEL06_07980, partial [Haliangiales bacterium]|nr:hypothetical protein [Haliangiales bacterium]
MTESAEDSIKAVCEYASCFQSRRPPREDCSLVSNAASCVPSLVNLMSHRPNNIFAGTQVVALVEVRGTNNSLVHPRGAVGVVTRTPAGAETHFLVRFPDGFEATLECSQLEVLKHFKDR